MTRNGRALLQPHETVSALSHLLRQNQDRFSRLCIWLPPLTGFDELMSSPSGWRRGTTRREYVSTPAGLLQSPFTNATGCICSPHRNSSNAYWLVPGELIQGHQAA
jgi:hypothetical protein